MWDALRPKAGPLFGSPALFGAEYENVSFRSKDGTTLKGWFVPTTAKGSAQHSRGVIVLCHGISCNRTRMLGAARILHFAGFDTLLFDFRGCGQSGGERYTIGYREVDDVIAAVRYLQSRPELRGEPIGVLGSSAGAATALMAAARCPEIAAVVAESPYAQLDRAVNNRFRLLAGPYGPVILAPARWIGEWMLGCSASSVSPIREISAIAPRPVLLIQDGGDAIAPPEETRDLLAAAGPGASLWKVPSARHACACEDDFQEYSRRIPSFFNRVFARARLGIHHRNR